MENDEVAAMAIAAIAEELGTDVRKVRIVSFQELESMQGENG